MRCQECLLCPICKPSLVPRMIVKREDGFNVLPFAMLWSDPSTTINLLGSDQIMNGPQSFSFRQRCFCQCLNSLFDRLNLTNTVQPVSYPRSVDNICKDLVLLCLYKDEERVVVIRSHFRFEMDFCETSDEFPELLNCCIFFCARQLKSRAARLLTIVGNLVLDDKIYLKIVLQYPQRHIAWPVKKMVQSIKEIKS